MKLKTLILAACFAIMAVVTMTPTESLAQAAVPTRHSQLWHWQGAMYSMCGR